MRYCETVDQFRLRWAPVSFARFLLCFVEDSQLRVLLWDKKVQMMVGVRHQTMISHQQIKKEMLPCWMVMMTIKMVSHQMISHHTRK